VKEMNRVRRLYLENLTTVDSWHGSNEFVLRKATPTGNA
jgi:hypothetical protein